jgi:hypothetical protein
MTLSRGSTSVAVEVLYTHEVPQDPLLHVCHTASTPACYRHGFERLSELLEVLGIPMPVGVTQDQVMGLWIEHLQRRP